MQIQKIQSQFKTVALVGRSNTQGIGEPLMALAQTISQRGFDVVFEASTAQQIGATGYPALQMLLLWSCLFVLQVHVPARAVFAAYAVERMLTLVPLTPGGLGLVETAATATLVGFGAPPVGAAAGVVLFRVFSYLIEIPLGALVAAAWFAHSRATRGPARQTGTGPA